MSRRMLMAVTLTASLVVPATMAHAGEPLDPGTYVMHLDGDVRVVLTVGTDGSVDVKAPDNVAILLERDADDRILDEFEVVIDGHAYLVDVDVHVSGDYKYAATALDVTVPMGDTKVVIAGPGEASPIASAKAARGSVDGKQMALSVRAKAASNRVQATGGADVSRDVLTLARLGAPLNQVITTTALDVAASHSQAARSTKPAPTSGARAVAAANATAEAKEARATVRQEAKDAREQVKDDRAQVKDDRPASQPVKPLAPTTSVDVDDEPSIDEPSAVSVASEPSVDEAPAAPTTAAPTTAAPTTVAPTTVAPTTTAPLVQDTAPASSDNDDDQADNQADDVKPATKPVRTATTDTTSSTATKPPKAAVSASTDAKEKVEQSAKAETKATEAKAEAKAKATEAKAPSSTAPAATAPQAAPSATKAAPSAAKANGNGKN